MTWAPGQVYEVTRGAWEIQELFDSAPNGATTIIDWYAGWATQCRADRRTLAELAVRYPGAVFARIDVGDGDRGENASLAREKVGNDDSCGGRGAD